ncbi:MAG: pyridoxamine 5'-phosphate oxidase [Gammaproteobacteria bacterium]|nr:pyridoxamine 5'-phosphate oxidase [Gammaproteobacteria bacterium]MDH4254399.1 pyridoxamine 5'-phosphate oxidase [Gammaproteobacteria bacterium]MDH5309332.1 pyridoxamine 5'-phosphate oxidase [Gammaproteobacteria bacterium]
MSNATPPDRLPEKLPDDPMQLASDWLDEATAREVQRNPNAMALVTLGADHRPSARVVLCKSFVADPGYIVFYTNYQSRKGRDISANADVALVFHWDALGRQVRIEGKAVFSPPAESDAYFHSRDWGSRLGAWGSDQSRPIASRDALVAQIKARAAELGLPLEPDAANPAAGSPPEIPRPPHWGGFRVWASSVELWVEGRDRIHDRAVWTRELAPADENEFAPTAWVGTRLQP